MFTCHLLCLQVSFFLFIVFVVYTMLPFSMRDAIIASVLTSTSHTVVLSVCLSTTVDQVVWQVRRSRSIIAYFSVQTGFQNHTDEVHFSPCSTCSLSKLLWKILQIINMWEKWNTPFFLVILKCTFYSPFLIVSPSSQKLNHFWYFYSCCLYF